MDYNTVMKIVYWLLSLMIIILLVQKIIIFKRNSYILELEEVIEKKIKLETTKLDKLEIQLNKELKIAAAKSSELRRKTKQNKSGIKMVKVKSKNNSTSKKNIISDFLSLDEKILNFENGLEKLKKGSKK